MVGKVVTNTDIQILQILQILGGLSFNSHITAGLIKAALGKTAPLTPETLAEMLKAVDDKNEEVSAAIDELTGLIVAGMTDAR